MKGKIITALILCVLGAMAVLIGCVGSRQPMGAAVDTDHNVLTGGPITGVLLEDLPAPVKRALKESVPHGEVADIDRTTNRGQIAYQFMFTEPDANPRLTITQNGEVLTNAESDLQPLSIP